MVFVFFVIPAKNLDNKEYEQDYERRHSDTRQQQQQQQWWYYLPTPPLGQDMTQGQFLSGV